VYYCFMNQKQLERLRYAIDHWIDVNGPEGLLRLAEKSSVSSSTITRARLGKLPKKMSTRVKLCTALGCKHEDLFGLVGAKSRAS